MVEKSNMNRSYRPGGRLGVIFRTAIRALQITAALGAVVIYGEDINNARKAGDAMHSDWMYALVVAVFSLIVAVIFLIPRITSFRYFFVDPFIAFLWLIVFGIFARKYLPEDCEGNSECKELKISVWFDFASVLLWVISGIVQFLFFNKDRTQTHSGSWRNTIRNGRGRSGYPHSNV